MKPRLIIFDMDGVLVDVSQSYRAAIKETVEFFSNSPVAYKEVQDMKNIGGYNNDWDLTEAILLNRGFNISKKLIVSKFQELYLGKNFDGYIQNEKWLLDIDVLRRLYNRYELAIYTGRPRAEAEYTLKRFVVGELFKFLLTMQEIPNDKHKPNPYGLNIILKKFNTNDAVYFGDTVDDMKMADELGIKAIGVLPPNADGELKKLLQDNGANVVLDNIDKIEEVLK